MIRREDQVFILEGKETMYAFCVLESGHLEHLYYGRKFKGLSLSALRQKRVFEIGNSIAYAQDHKEIMLEDLCLEMSSYGKGDIREPFVEIQHADGAFTCDFLYDRYEIKEKKEALETLPSAYDEENQVEQLIIYLKDPSYDLTLQLRYEVYEECDCIIRSAILENTSQELIHLKRLMSQQLDLSRGDYCLTSFHGAWAREMEKETRPIGHAGLVVSSMTGTSSSRSNPFTILHEANATEDAGQCYGMNLIYSGNHYTSVSQNAYGKIRVVSGISPSEFSFALEPGQRFEAPEALLTYTHQGFTQMSHNLHRFVRNHVVRGSWKKKDRPILLNSWEATYFDIKESQLLKMAKAAKKAGIELFVMDDGWFGQRNDDAHSLGDWQVNTKKLPGGLKRLGDQINALGLDFGIWVEPEMVNEDSKLYREHPDWTLAIEGKPHSMGRNQRILDLTNPAVLDYIIDSMTKVFESANISYVKWDMNRIFSDAYAPYLPKERQGEVFHRYCQGLYKVMKTLTEKFPDILFEGCAAGGNRFDLGILSYFPQIWASDNTDAICRSQIQEGYSYGYPLSTISAHVSACPNHQTLRKTPLSTRFHVAAFGILGYECNFNDLPKKDLEEIKAQIELYKKYRKTLQWGEFYRGRSGRIHEWSCVSQDQSQALGLLMQEQVRANSQSEYYMAKGLKSDELYHFFSQEQKVDLLEFGDLVNTSTPVHIKQDSLLHRTLAHFVTMPGEVEDEILSGGQLMYAGVSLKQGFSASGYSDQVRYFQDYSSRLYQICQVEKKAIEEGKTEEVSR